MEMRKTGRRAWGLEALPVWGWERKRGGRYWLGRAWEWVGWMSWGRWGGGGTETGMRERRKGRDEAGAEMAIGNEGIGGSMTVKAGHIDDTGQRTGQCRDGPIEESVQEVSRGGGMIIGVAKSGQGATRGGRIMTEAEESDQTITRGGEMLMGTEGSGNEAIRRLSLNEEDNSRGGKRLQKIKGDSKLQNLTPLRVPSLDLLAREDI